MVALRSDVKRAAQNFGRAMNGLSPLAPEGAISLCEDDERGRLAVAPTRLTPSGNVSTVEP